MEKFWLKSYPPGVPAEIDPSQYSSLGELFEESFREYRTKPAFVCMGKQITYGELDALSGKLAAWFQSKGLARGARIAIMMPNVLQYPVAIAAILRAGYVVVNVNPLYTPRELEHQLKDSGAEAIIILENFAVTLQAVVRNSAVKHVIVASMGDLMDAKGLIVNFVVRRVKRWCPRGACPVTSSSTSPLPKVHAMSSSRSSKGRTMLRSSSTQAARPASRKARPCCIGI
jgi:long-chain acyl-CoA synthetase